MVEYSSNNSGGNWWLSDKDWKNLDKAGWKVVWAWEEYVYDAKGGYVPDAKGYPKTVKKSKKERYLGALAKYAYKKFDTIQKALQEFEKITKQDISDEGCNCCGAPHNFNWSSFGCNSGFCTCKGPHKDYNYASGEDLIAYLYEVDGTISKRELIKKLLNK